MTTKMVFHGSDIEKICEYYHLNKEDIIKFGANVNPLGLSSKVRDSLASNIDLFSSYPDRNYTSLRNTISEYCNIPADFILPGNGSSELIALVIQEKAPKHTLILGPTYSEYSRELSFSGSTQEYYHLQEKRNFCLDVDDLCGASVDLLVGGGYKRMRVDSAHQCVRRAVGCGRKIYSYCHGGGVLLYGRAVVERSHVEAVTVEILDVDVAYDTVCALLPSRRRCEYGAVFGDYGLAVENEIGR